MAPSAIDINEQYAPVTPKESLIEPIDQFRDGNKDAKNLVQNALRARVETIDTDICETGEEDAFYVADMGEVYRQHLRWKLNLPRVKPHYGIY